MKKVLFIFLTFGLLFSACSTSTNSPSNLIGLIGHNTNTEESDKPTDDNDNENTLSDDDKNTSNEEENVDTNDDNNENTDEENTSNEEEENVNTDENNPNDEENVSSDTENTNEEENVNTDENNPNENENTPSENENENTSTIPTEPTVPSYYLKMDFNELFNSCFVSFTNGIDTTGYRLPFSYWKGNGWAIVWGDNHSYYLLCNINGTQYVIKNLKYKDNLYKLGFANSKLHYVVGRFYSLDTNTQLSGYDMYIESNKLVVSGSIDGVYKYIDTQNGYIVIIDTNQ